MNSDQCIQTLREQQPDVVVVSGTRIIAVRVLNCVSAVFIDSMWASLLSIAAFMVDTGLWWKAIVMRLGSTVHEVDPGVDSGHILGQAGIAPHDADNLVTYSLLQQVAGLPLMKQAILDACERRLCTLPAPPGTSRLWTHPTLGEYLYHRVKSGVK